MTTDEEQPTKVIRSRPMFTTWNPYTGPYIVQDDHQRLIRPMIPGATPGTHVHEPIPMPRHACVEVGRHRVPDEPAPVPVRRGVNWRSIGGWAGVGVLLILVAVFIGTCFTVVIDAVREAQ